MCPVNKDLQKEINQLSNGWLYRRGADLADKTYSIEPVFGAESLRAWRSPPHVRVQAVLGVF